MKINRKILLTLFLGTTFLLNPVLGMDQSALEKKRLEKSQERKKLVRSNSSPDSLRKFEDKKSIEPVTTESNFKLSPTPQTIGSTECICCKKSFSFFNKYINDKTPKFCLECVFKLLKTSSEINNNKEQPYCNEELACKICSFFAMCDNKQYPVCSLCLVELEKWALEEEQCWKDKEVKERLEKNSYDKKN
jgi:hypothetical protein